MRRKKRQSAHDRELRERLRELERDPLRDPVAADHTDEYPDPEPVNGRIPDIRGRSVLGETFIEEVEHRGDNSQHTQDQHTAFENGDEPFRVEFVDESDDDNGLFLWL